MAGLLYAFETDVWVIPRSAAIDFRVALLGRILEIAFLQNYINFFGLRNIEPVALLQMSVTVAPLLTNRSQHPSSKQQATLTLKLDTGNRQV